MGVAGRVLLPGTAPGPGPVADCGSYFLCAPAAANLRFPTRQAPRQVLGSGWAGSAPGGTSGGSRAGPRHTHQAAPLGWGPVANLSPGGSPQARGAVRASAWPPPGTGRSALPAAAALSSFSWVPAMGLVTRRQCSRTENTVCVCDQGHFCVSESGDDCAECRPHTACRPGQRVQQRGERQTAGGRPPGPQHPLRGGPQTQAQGGGSPAAPLA